MIREIRVLIEDAGRLRKVCKLAFSKKDASLYIFTYARNGRYFFGRQVIPEQQLVHSFDFIEDAVYSKQAPKLSIHESGQIHIYMSSGKVGPLQIPPLSTLRGHHVASVSIDAFDRLPVHERLPLYKGKTHDVIIRTDGNVQSAVLAIYINGATPTFWSKDLYSVITLRRSTLESPLFIGIRARGQQPLGDIKERQGVIVIAGWNPAKDYSEQLDYLYIRGE